MSSNGIAWVSLCIIATSLLAQSPSAVAAPATQTPAPLRFFSNGDRLRVTVTGLFEPGKTAVFDRRIGDGKIFVPYAGEIEIADMSPRLAERAIAAVCFQQRGLTRPNVKVELVKAHDPATQDDLFQVNCGDWIRMRIWEGKDLRETQYVLCVGADGDIRFPGAGLIHIANHKWMTAEAAVAAALKKHGLFNDPIIVLEEMSDAEAQSAPVSQRVWLLPPSTQPTTRPDTEPRNLSDDPNVKFLALPWIHDTRVTYEMHNPTLMGTEYSAVGRVEWVLERGAPVRPTRVIWETTLPDGFYEFSASAPTKAGLFSKLVSAYEHAFGCTITQERREIPVLILGADKAVAEKVLPVSSSLV
jgi:protein involved in polysaccharide export with SLBB domain